MTDEFNGTELNTEKWQSNPLENGWTWIGRPPGLFQAKNVVVKDGKMNVTVGVLDEPVVRDENEYLYEGAIVRSKHAGEKGWYYETRMKANATEMSSTFWLMTRGHTKKKLELDIQECVGVVSPNADSWARNWDEVFHSNLIHRVNRFNPEKVQRQGQTKTPTKNHERFYVYAAWWKSEDEVQFFLDGKYVYSIKPSIEWDVPAFIQMAIETYDWNPVPEDGGMVKRGNWEQRTTKYDWVRVWRLENGQPSAEVSKVMP
ncbi:MAG: glycosyl hydrolase [Verrucomicrobiota bacterium]